MQTPSGTEEVHYPPDPIHQHYQQPLQNQFVPEQATAGQPLEASAGDRTEEEQSRPDSELLSEAAGGEPCREADSDSSGSLTSDLLELCNYLDSLAADDPNLK